MLNIRPFHLVILDLKIVFSCVFCCFDNNNLKLCFLFHFFFLLGIIGTGTFGRVCLCHDKTTDKYCAMKILAMSDVIRLKQVEHVKNEKSILTEVNHPFIVNL